MQYHYVEDAHLGNGELEVLVKSRVLNGETQDFLDYLEAYSQEVQAVLPVKTSDRIEMLRLDDIVLADVVGNRLILETSKGRFETNERLYRLKQRLGHSDFVQVSKHALININHLEALEASFSGNMLALLTGHLKTDVSRRYLPNLEKRLGL